MGKKRREQAKLSPESSAAERLDGLNARLSRSNAPEKIRRVVEAQIEAKARKRRKRETPASSGYKRV